MTLQLSIKNLAIEGPYTTSILLGLTSSLLLQPHYTGKGTLKAPVPNRTLGVVFEFVCVCLVFCWVFFPSSLQGLLLGRTLKAAEPD